MARIKPGVPTVKEIREGESEYRYIHGTGLVLYTRYSNQLYSTKMHAASTPPDIDKKQKMAIGRGGGGSFSQLTGAFIRRDGTVTYTGSQSFGNWDIRGVYNIDVDGATTLDNTSINTSDRHDESEYGYFNVEGDGYISMSTSDINSNISIDSNSDVLIHARKEFGVGDQSSAPINTSLYSIQDSIFHVNSDGGAGYTPTLKLFSGDMSEGPNAHKQGHVYIVSSASGNYDLSSATIGLNLETRTSGTENSQNCILIQQTGTILPGFSEDKAGVTWTPEMGIDIRGDSSVRIRAEESDNEQYRSNLWMRAVGNIYIGAGTGQLYSRSSFQPAATKVSGLFEYTDLYKPFGTGVVIRSDQGWTNSWGPRQLNGEALHTYTSSGSTQRYIERRTKSFPKHDGISAISLSQAQTHMAVASNKIDNPTGGQPYRDKGRTKMEVDEHFTLLSNHSRGFFQHEPGTVLDGTPLIESRPQTPYSGTDFHDQGTVWLVTVTWYTLVTQADVQSYLWSDDFGIQVGLICGRGMRGTYQIETFDPNDFGVQALSDMKIRAPHVRDVDDTYYEELGYLTSYSTLPSNNNGHIYYIPPNVNADSVEQDDIESGIQWHNGTGEPVDVFASVLRLQSGDMFKTIYGIPFTGGDNDFGDDDDDDRTGF